jgi:glycolate oxidase FAD binding subunit
MTDVVTPGAAATPRRSIGGIAPSHVEAPESIADLQELLRASQELGVVVSGHGTKLDFGATPSRYDLQIDLTRLPSLINHSPGDLVARVAANTPMRELAAVLGRAGQRLSIDEVVANSTVGGVVATALSGPLRFRFGAVRDLLIGVSYVRADGVAAKAGGIVVKNVAGYDLSKLLCGSFGTLAVLTECVFRLHPLPERQRVLTATLGPREAGATARAIAAGVQDPTSIEIDVKDDEAAELAVLVEGSAVGSQHRAHALLALLGESAREIDTLPPWWGELPGPVVIKVTFASSLGAEVVSEIQRCCGKEASIRGSIALGILNVGLVPETTSGELEGALTALRARLLAFGGGVQVLRASGEQKAGVDLFGPVSGLDLMERVKVQFDPKLMLGPGRFVGGW